MFWCIMACLSGEAGLEHPTGLGPSEAVLDGVSVRVD